MIIIVDPRELVRDAYISQFEKESYAVVGFDSEQFEAWVGSEIEDEIAAVHACIISCDIAPQLDTVSLRRLLNAPIVALMDSPNLEDTLRLFACGFDDVLRKPIHAREILARISANARRIASQERSFVLGDLEVFFDGRDPQIRGEVFALPRRERRILEYLASIHGRRANKSQIFNAVYGVFNDDVEENVIESHLSKLRKKLRGALGFDPVDSKRFLGYSIAADMPTDIVDPSPVPMRQLSFA